MVSKKIKTKKAPPLKNDIQRCVCLLIYQRLFHPLHLMDINVKSKRFFRPR